MRLLVLPLILAALPASAAPPAALPEAPPLDTRTIRPLDNCTSDLVHRAETPRRAEGKKLGELPPGDLILSVYNQVEGCMEPVIVRYGDGRAPAPALPQPVRPRARLWR